MTIKAMQRSGQSPVELRTLCPRVGSKPASETPPNDDSTGSNAIVTETRSDEPWEGWAALRLRFEVSAEEDQHERRILREVLYNFLTHGRPVSLL